MRILHLASEYPPIQVFGLGRAVCDLATAQAAMGEEVHVVTNSIGGKDQDAEVDGVFVHRIDFPPPPKPPDDTMAVQQFNVSALETAVRVSQRVGAPDVIHVHDWLTVLAGAEAKWLYPEARLAVTIHDTAQGKYFGSLTMPQQYMAHLERWAGMTADCVICCSRYVGREMVDSYGCPPDKIAIIPCGVDGSRFAVEGDLAQFRTMFAAPDEQMILYVGRLDPEKGLPVLLDAMAQVIALCPRAKLVIVGKGQLQEQLQQQMRSLNLRDRAQFAGYLTGPTLAGAFKCADVMVVPSLYEPFGIVALEGMVNRVPVVIADSGGLGEIVEDGRTGLKVPPRNPQALAQAITRLLLDEALRRQIGQAGYEQAVVRYQWADVARQTVEAYGVGVPVPSQ